MFYICAVYAPFVDNSAATVLSRLDYRNAVLVGLPAATPARLQSVMHETARLVLDLKPRDHITPGLRGLHWLPIMQRIEYKLCLLVHKTLIGQAPPRRTTSPTCSRWSLTFHHALQFDWKRSPLLQARSEDSLLRASSNGNLFQPRTERRIGNHAFSVAEHRAWK